MAPPFENPDDHAIIVGIDHYAQGIASLSGAINDCKLFEEWLVTPGMGGLDPANVTKLLSSGPPPSGEPRHQQIENKLYDYYGLVRDQLWQGGRRLYLFFAGHGVTKRPPYTDQRGLVMADSQADMLRGLDCGLPAKVMWRTRTFKEVIMVMDCCAEVAQQIQMESSLAQLGDLTVTDRAFIHIHAAPVGVTTVERIMPHPLRPNGEQPLCHGVLTNRLLLGLTTTRDANGQVTAKTLKEYLYALKDDAPTIEDNQDQAVPPPPIVFGPPTAKVPARVTLRDGAILFQVRDRGFNVIQQPRAAPATVKLSPGLWLFDAMDANGVIVASKSVSLRESADVLI